MKLVIGENIRNFRKKNDLTQEALADRLGVTYQSISRWENDVTYPDLELLPAIAEVLSVTVDELLGMPQVEKEKRAARAYDELRRECMKSEYDADKIVELLRDIRRNYLNTDSAWRPWVEGNDRAFRDPKILPEARLLVEAYLKLHPMNAHAIETMAEIEDEEHLNDFLDRYTTPFDCSARALMFDRYLRRGDAEKFEPERRYQLFSAFDILLGTQYLMKWGEGGEYKHAVDEFIEDMLALIRRDAADDRPDMWVDYRIDLALKSAARSLSSGDRERALAQTEAAVRLLEDTMAITDDILLPTSCRFLDGMEWHAAERFCTPDNNPDSSEERMIDIHTEMRGVSYCYLIAPSRYYGRLCGDSFAELRDDPEYVKLCERVKALIKVKPKEE